MGKKIFIWAAGIILLFIVLFFAFGSNEVSSFEAIENFNGEINIYSSGGCGCCGVYSNYFQGRGKHNAKFVNLDTLNTLKRQYGVPSQLESCHTTIIGDYFVEGHIPLEAVEKLLTEKPDIKGIAMPGMPPGSPGMTGAKKEAFVIYAVNRDGSYEEFMRI